MIETRRIMKLNVLNHQISPLQYAEVCNVWAAGMHNRFKKQDSIHGDAIHSPLSLDTALLCNILCLLVARSNPFLGG